MNIIYKIIFNFTPKLIYFKSHLLIHFLKRYIFRFYSKDKVFTLEKNNYQHSYFLFYIYYLQEKFYILKMNILF